MAFLSECEWKSLEKSLVRSYWCCILAERIFGLCWIWCLLPHWTSTGTPMPTGKRREICSNLMCVPMMNYLCGALEAFKDAKFLFYHLTFLYNQIRGDADSILLLFNQVCFQWLLPKQSQMLTPVTCLFQITRIWGKSPPTNSVFCSRVMCFVLPFLYCVLQFALTKMSLVPFLQPLGTCNCLLHWTKNST